jgi:hypothetical protein
MACAIWSKYAAVHMSSKILDLLYLVCCRCSLKRAFYSFATSRSFFWQEDIQIMSRQQTQQQVKRKDSGQTDISKAGNRSPKICREWQSGRECRFGGRCRFSHDDPSIPLATKKATNSSNQGKPSGASVPTEISVTRPKKAKQPKWSMQPSRHQDVLHLLQDCNLSFHFHELDEPHGSTQTYDTNIMGQFECHNRTCASKGWPSKMIAITIRLYGDSRYNARVYHQRCRRCNQLSRPELDNSYAERIVYRLKKWSGIEMELPAYSGQSRGPHQSEFCEGCKDGHCSFKSS